jgi:hypothetical protein
MVIPSLIVSDANFNHLAKVILPGISTNLAPFLPFHIILCHRKSPCLAPLQGLRAMLFLSGWGGIYGILLFIYSVMHYTNMQSWDIYTVLGVISRTVLFIFAVQIFLVLAIENSFCWLLCPFDIPLLLCFVSTTG